MNTLRRASLVALWLGAGGIGTSTVASAGDGISADVAPPPAREERAPAPRDGYVWTPGYWEWNGHAYSWVSGRFIFGHRGAHWVPDRWDQAGSQWQHVNGHWEH
jgi:YXWGXW repeat-containing protein